MSGRAHKSNNNLANIKVLQPCAEPALSGQLEISFKSNTKMNFIKSEKIYKNGRGELNKYKKQTNYIQQLLSTHDKNNTRI